MVRLEEKKALSQDRAIEKLALPAFVYIPLIQHIGSPCVPLVNVQDKVLTGQKIAQADAQVSSPVHASLSGEVTAIKEWPHPVLGRSKTIIIENDDLDQGQKLSTKSPQDIERLNPEQIRELVVQAGIVGMGGAGFPTQIKLNPPKPVDTLILNGAECEPYLTGDYRLMLEHTKEILLGLELALKCLGVKKVYIAIEENKPEAIKAFNQELRAKSHELWILKSYYPQGGERQLIKNILNREVPSGKLPFDIGVVVHNVATVFAVYEAVYQNKPLYERVVTVTGSCLESQKNLLVRIGTPIKNLIDCCGPLKERPAKIIAGGPMMGIAQYTDSAPVIKTTSGIILLTDRESQIFCEDVCIRCGECIRQCPAGLEPCIISQAVENQDWELVKLFSPADCIECGLCSYVCPAKRNLVQSIKFAKLKAR